MAHRLKFIASVERGQAHVSVRGGDGEKLNFAGTLQMSEESWVLLEQILVDGSQSVPGQLELHSHGGQDG